MRITLLVCEITTIGSSLSILWHYLSFGFPGGSDGKVSAYNAGDSGSIPGSGRSPREGNGNPLSYFVVQSLSCVRLFVTPWTAARQASLFFTIWSLLQLMSIELALSPCHLTILSSVVPFSSCLHSFPASRSFLMSQLLHTTLKN